LLKKSSRFFGVVLLLVAMLAVACGGKSTPAGGGDGSLDRVKKAGKLMVAVDTTYPPMEYVEGDKTVGYDVDLANELGKKLGVKVEFVTVDWNGIITGLVSKRYDVIMSSMNITEERLKEVNFVEYARMSQVFVAKKGVSIKSEADLSGKTVLVQDGTTSHDYAKTVKSVKEIISYGGATEAFQALKNGKGDVIIIDEPVGLYYAAKDAATFAITGRAMEPEPVGIAIRKEDKDLAAALEKALADSKSDGSYKKIAEKWFGGELGK